VMVKVVASKVVVVKKAVTEMKLTAMSWGISLVSHWITTCSKPWLV
jgi:hypothetical protein